MRPRFTDFATGYPRKRKTIRDWLEGIRKDAPLVEAFLAGALWASVVFGIFMELSR